MLEKNAGGPTPKDLLGGAGVGTAAAPSWKRKGENYSAGVHTDLTSLNTPSTALFPLLPTPSLTHFSSHIMHCISAATKPELAVPELSTPGSTEEGHENAHFRVLPSLPA